MLWSLPEVSSILVSILVDTFSSFYKLYLKAVMLMTNEEQSRLANFRSMATMNQGQALEYHILLDKLAEEVEPT